MSSCVLRENCIFYNNIIMCVWFHVCVLLKKVLLLSITIVA